MCSCSSLSSNPSFLCGRRRCSCRRRRRRTMVSDRLVFFRIAFSFFLGWLFLLLLFLSLDKLNQTHDEPQQQRQAQQQHGGIFLPMGVTRIIPPAVHAFVVRNDGRLPLSRQRRSPQHGSSLLLLPSSVVPSSPRLVLNHHPVEIVAEMDVVDLMDDRSTTDNAVGMIDWSNLGLLGELVQNPIFWSTAIMLSIVFLLYSWEQTIKSARSALPDTIQPVVDSMLVEMGGLGFIGLFLSITVIEGPFGSVVGGLSQQFLGEPAILLESFEFLHEAFFEVAVSFFMITALTVVSVVQQVESLERVSRAIFDLDGDGDVSLGEIAKVLNVDSMVLDLDGDGELSDEEIRYGLQVTAPRSSTLWKAAFKSTSDIQAEALMIRERLLQKFPQTIPVQSSTFQVETYFVKIFGRNLEEMVELSPLTWVPLIPVVALGRSIDLSREVVSASSSNAFESCGEFISSPSYLAAQTVSLVLALIWGIWNFWKMVQIKNMLLPKLVQTPPGSNPEGGGCVDDAHHEPVANAVLLPPRYEDDYFLDQFNSSPFPFNLIESIWGHRHPPRHRHESLFGAAGSHGPEIYQSSIKLQTWFVVAQLVFILGQIVTRDMAAVAAGIPELVVGRPDWVVPELALYCVYSVLLAAQLWLVPKTFLDYSLVTSIERLIEVDVLSEACLLDGECRIDDPYVDTAQSMANITTTTRTDDTTYTTATAPITGDK